MNVTGIPNRVVAFLAASVLIGSSGGALAQGDATRAEALFREGRESLEKGDHQTACARFDESLRLVRRPSTLLNLAECDRQAGKLTRALARAQEAMMMLPPDDARLPTAKNLIDDLSARAPRVSLSLPAGGGRVTIDGKEVPAAALKQDIALDPGDHEIVLSVVGHADSSVRVLLVERDRRRVQLVAGPVAPSPSPSPPAPAEPDAAAEGGGTRRTIGFIAAGIGVAGLVAGGVTGVMILGNDGTIEENCPNKRCNPEGVDAIDRSNTLIAVNYVALGVGVAGLAAGAVLILTSGSSGGRPHEASSGMVLAPMAAPGGGALAMRGRF